MNKKTLLILGFLLQTAGWFSAFALNSLPHKSNLYILGPTLLLGVGIGITRKAVCGKKTAVTLVFTALFGLLLLNQLFPDKSVSISAFKQRMKDGFKGTLVSVEVRDQDRSGTFTQKRQLEVFANVKIQLFAHLPAAPAMMTFDPAGHLYVTIPRLGAVYRLTDVDSDGFADTSTLFCADFDRPSGIAWVDDKLYIAQPDQLLEISTLRDTCDPEHLRIVADNLPDDGGHWKRALAASDTGKIFLSIGSRCNVCEEKNKLRGTVVKIDPASGEKVVFATGLRDSVGLSISPLDKTFWGTDIGRDDLGANLPPDEINQISSGGHYGWPYCYGDKIVDPLLGSDEICQKTEASQVDLPAHSVPTGIAFGTMLNAPPTARDSIYVALHGQSEGETITAGKLIQITTIKGQVADHGKEFIRGWGKGTQAWGQPSQVIAGPDGNLYVSDDKAQVIYRISWEQKR